MRHVVEKGTISETARFGDGRAVVSSDRYTIPITLGNLAMMIEVCAVPAELCLPLGRGFMENYSPAIGCKNRELRVGVPSLAPGIATQRCISTPRATPR